MLNNDLELNRSVYDKRWEFLEIGTYEPYLEVIAKIIEDKNCRRVAEVGCGNGKVGYFLKNVVKNCEVKLYGTDISKLAIQKSTELNVYEQLQLRDDFKIPEGEYDLIVLASVIEHIYNENLDILFEDINKKLKTGGGVFIVVPNIKSPYFLLFDSEEAQIEKLGHINLKSRNEWNKYFKKHGFFKMQYSFPIRLNYIERLKLFKNPVLNVILKLMYFLLPIWPFYYLRNSFWVYLEKTN